MKPAGMSRLIGIYALLASALCTVEGEPFLAGFLGGLAMLLFWISTEEEKHHD